MEKNGNVSGGGNIYNADWIHIIILYIICTLAEEMDDIATTANKM